VRGIGRSFEDDRTGDVVEPNRLIGPESCNAGAREGLDRRADRLRLERLPALDRVAAVGHQHARLVDLRAQLPIGHRLHVVPHQAGM
jgi:hypothetical protein